MKLEMGIRKWAMANWHLVIGSREKNMGEGTWEIEICKWEVEEGEWEIRD